MPIDIPKPTLAARFSQPLSVPTSYRVLRTGILHPLSYRSPGQGLGWATLLLPQAALPYVTSLWRMMTFFSWSPGSPLTPLSQLLLF